MEAGPKDLTEATQAMESYRERLVGLVASGRSMTDMDVVRLSQEVDRCINLIYRLSHASAGPGANLARAAPASGNSTVPLSI
ncbi:MAG: Spo0E family sporulation regulatory protein-aspartic acid phosphatase [Bacillota bacterium]